MLLRLFLQQAQMAMECGTADDIVAPYFLRVSSFAKWLNGSDAPPGPLDSGTLKAFFEHEHGLSLATELTKLLGEGLDAEEILRS